MACNMKEKNVQISYVVFTGDHKGACCKEIKINMFYSQEIRRARGHMCVRGVEALRP